MDKGFTELLRASRSMLIFCGAGVSTASGIPDFRGPNGIWKTRKPVLYEDFMSSHAARVEYWDYKLDSWGIYDRAQPNAVHRAIVTLEHAGKVAGVVTQNVDGLHRRAGTSPALLVELHGTDRLVECQTCHATSEPAPHMERFRETRIPPRCPCGGLLKSATISFGQSLRSTDLDRAVAAASNADLVVAMGSTLAVHPAASIPLLAAQRGVPYVIVNQGPSDHDGHPCVTLRLDGDVTTIFPEAVGALRPLPIRA